MEQCDVAKLFPFRLEFDLSFWRRVDGASSYAQRVPLRLDVIERGKHHQWNQWFNAFGVGGGGGFPVCPGALWGKPTWREYSWRRRRRVPPGTFVVIWHRFCCSHAFGYSSS